jgi:leucyl-tRNA synthetase
LLTSQQEFATCDPAFYKHTQRLFLLLLEHGLAYQAESLVNYDPTDKTVLANEQVDANGCSWRSGAKVEKRLLKQWFLRISAFREALLNDLEILSKEGRWPERVLSMQKNWLGRSKGARLHFQVFAYDQKKYKSIEVFTTRPDTLFGVQYVALATDHPLVLELSKTDVQLQDFLKTAAVLPQDSKDGYLLGSIRAINPIAYESSTPDATKASLPIYVAPYVLADYGDGAVMGVPGHDSRDFAFWKQNCGETPIRTVVKPATSTLEVTEPQEAFIRQGILTSHSGIFSGKTSAEAGNQIVELLKIGGLGEPAETWRLRDWLISRQRYWGTPIPIIHCDSCGAVPVPDDQLPVELPVLEGHWLRGKAGNPLDEAHEWANTSCPKCKAPSRRDTDTMDTFVDSSWYFMRFVSPHLKGVPFSDIAAEKMLPVDLYIGGVEHAILHLLYARFISKFLATTPLWPAGAKDEIRGEPFKRLLTQGMVHGKTYKDPSTGRFLKPEEVDTSNPSKPTIVATGEVATVSFEKMSKSKYNGVDPSTCISKYGADATRAHMLFQAPPSEVLEWDEEKIMGVTRWLKKIYGCVNRHRNSLSSLPLNPSPQSYFRTNLPLVPSMREDGESRWDKSVALWLTVQRTIISVTESLSQTNSLNTVVSDLMSLSNALLESEEHCERTILIHALETLIRLMAPLTPAFAEESWELLRTEPSSSPSPSIPSIFTSPFPIPDSTLSLLKPRSQRCAVQVNGRLRFAIDIPIPPPSLDHDALVVWAKERIFDSPEGRRLLRPGDGKDVTNAKKVIVVKGGRVVNFVL